MKAEFDKEIDSLLRQRARRGRTAPGAPGALADGALLSAHLDADEQNAYAENALPAVARSRYTAHLADCDDCRRGVTQLALAAGMPTQLEPREIATGQTSPQRATWRERLAALFAPGARRYAVPALALLLVSAVSLIVLTRRTQREAAVETSIARRNSPDAQRPQVAQPEAHHAPQNGNLAVTTATPGDRSANAEMNSDTSPARDEIAANSQRVETVQPLTGAVTSDAAPPPPVPATGSGAVARAMSESATPMPTPAPVVEQATITSEQEAKSKSGETVPESAKTERRQGGFEDRQYNNRRDQISGPRRNEQARNTRAADADDARNSAATAAPAALPPPAAAKRTREADRRKDENLPAESADRSAGAGSAAETRTVAGRKFRRQGNAWVDANYNAGQSYTVVRRNSEQFRALVADEPGLRRIADALGGEVTVVWKGRAYRIR